MEKNFSIEDRGQPNPRQAEVDRLRDAAARSMQANALRPARLSDDVSLGRVRQTGAEARGDGSGRSATT